MDSQILSLSFFTLLLILISQSPMPTNAQPDATQIVNVCKNTIDNYGCLAVLRGLPQFSNARNYRDISKFALELAIRKGTETQDFFKGLLQKNSSPSIRYCAFFCYDGVIGSFKSALSELDKDVRCANYDARVAGDGANYCQTQLASHQILDPAISSRNNEILLLSSIAFAATSFLQKDM